ncbi:MAG TPA: protoporphyrinogen oxidase, partial [candidate division Zixibacteria bacterium]|nr:protoporphyrinogen oxidase [candidate division Zixibacteria bacterium]
GFLVPKKENLKILGSIWTSSIFSHRAPNGMVQFRTMVGGDGDHESIKLSDDALLDAVQANLDAIVGINGKPTLTKIYRWSRGIPQFKIGHAKIMDKLEKELTQQGNLFITGNAYYGISLNDCIKQSYKVVEQI